MICLDTSKERKRQGEGGVCSCVFLDAQHVWTTWHVLLVLSSAFIRKWRFAGEPSCLFHISCSALCRKGREKR